LRAGLDSRKWDWMEKPHQQRRGKQEKRKQELNVKTRRLKLLQPLFKKVRAAFEQGGKERPFWLEGKGATVSLKQ